VSAVVAELALAAGFGVGCKASESAVAAELASASAVRLPSRRGGGAGLAAVAAGFGVGCILRSNN
jgi:hypothetical protein